MAKITHSPDAQGSTPESIFFRCSTEFYRQINNILDVYKLISNAVNYSKERRWKAPYITYDDAEACVDQLKESTMIATEIFESTKQAAILADKNRSISELIFSHPIKDTFRKFVSGDIGKEELQAKITKAFGVGKNRVV